MRRFTVLVYRESTKLEDEYIGCLGKHGSEWRSAPEIFERLNVVEETPLTAAAPDLYEALDKIVRRLQMDIDDGGRPDEWSMRALVQCAQDAQSKATESKA